MAKKTRPGKKSGEKVIYCYSRISDWLRVLIQLIKEADGGVKPQEAYKITVKSAKAGPAGVRAAKKRARSR